jgi:hypothetical protein
MRGGGLCRGGAGFCTGGGGVAEAAGAGSFVLAISVRFISSRRSSFGIEVSMQDENVPP